MTNIFKTTVTKEFMQAADDPLFAPAVVQVPSDAPYMRVPDMHRKQHTPQHVVNVERPRYGHSAGYGKKGD